MWRQVITSIALTVIVWPAATILASSGEPLLESQQRVSVTRNLTSMPLAFTENQGQWDEKVKYRANTGGATMWFTETGAYYQFTRRVPKAEEDVTRSDNEVTLSPEAVS